MANKITDMSKIIKVVEFYVMERVSIYKQLLIPFKKYGIFLYLKFSD